MLTDLSTPHWSVIPQSDVTRTGPNLKQKRIVTLIPGRDEHFTGLGLDWIRTIAYFVEFGLDPECQTRKI